MKLKEKIVEIIRKCYNRCPIAWLENGYKEKVTKNIDKVATEIMAEIEKAMPKELDISRTTDNNSIYHMRGWNNCVVEIRKALELS